jgi:heme A synthase
MTSGLILLLLIAAAVAFGYTKLRGKMKLPVAGKHWTGAIIIVVLVVLMLWAGHKTGKP